MNCLLVVCLFVLVKNSFSDDSSESDIATNRPDDQGAVSTISSTTHLTGVDPTSVSQSSTPHDPHLVTTVPLTGTSERTTEGASNINTKTEIQSKSIDISVNLIASNNTLSPSVLTPKVVRKPTFNLSEVDNKQLLKFYHKLRKIMIHRGLMRPKSKVPTGHPTVQGLSHKSKVPTWHSTVQDENAPTTRTSSSKPTGRAPAQEQTTTSTKTEPVNAVDRDHDVQNKPVNAVDHDHDVQNKPGTKIIRQAPDSSHFAVVFLVVIALLFGLYALYHNRQKIIAVVVEGRSVNGRGGRERYRKLDSESVEPEARIKNSNEVYVY